MSAKPSSRLAAATRRFLFTLPAALAALLVTSDSTFAAEKGITVAATADIFAVDAKVVSDAILARPSLSAVLLAGDTDNATPTPLASYQKLYKGTYGRFMDRIYPCPGNHDRHSTPPFSAYCAFWGKAAHAPEMYYSFDLGEWHIVSLDSVTFTKDKAKASAQLRWLEADLAANPGKPILAYWHYPLFSNANHCGTPKMKPFWDAIYAHGPALVVNGHNHVYERFSPMNPEGNVVPETKGIQEFVISVAGAKPVDKESKKAKGPASARFHGGTHHVGFFTLYPDGGYVYEIESITGKGIREVVDRGVGNLSGGAKPALN